jgi:prephenate dehydrogenase
LIFDKISVIGVGLMGASFALAAKKYGVAKRVSGHGRNRATLDRAVAAGVIDDYTMDMAELCRGSGLVLIATPVGAFRAIGAAVRAHLKRGTIVCDVGSVKGALVHDMESFMPPGVHFVGVHPIKGSETSGFESAYAGFYQGAKCIVTPTEQTDKDAMNVVVEAWERIGCKIIYLSPEKHDEVFSLVSHLPHIAAYALVGSVAAVDKDFIEYGGSGFLDTTRVAMSSAEVWSDICLDNRENILNHIDIYIERLQRIKRIIEAGDDNALKREFDASRALRSKLKNV